MDILLNLPTSLPPCAVATASFSGQRNSSRRHRWLLLLRSYGQETSLHGLRYIIEPNSLMCRRYRWTLPPFHGEWRQWLKHYFLGNRNYKIMGPGPDHLWGWWGWSLRTRSPKGARTARYNESFPPLWAPQFLERKLRFNKKNCKAS